ncbi:hypothetical protein HMPREF9629_01098 [Peptoanaerobacter stomatis]|uniref:Uncharacterized protein n=1 Tax=Peptoanaerobacter stomatis TaxID=796937 RepID=G9WY47_9FIRM|nr:hypothetical protein [Peptoanaerobacter stomatis]EHL16551.1 hypothetical protein HMPREF9629_01098 [Peptoanaerobacter stomatis]
MDKFLNYLSETDEFMQMDRAISERNTPILLNGISTESIPFFWIIYIVLIKKK